MSSTQEPDKSPNPPIEEVEKAVSEHSNKDGTIHQAELGLRAHRKHFFAPFDPAYAAAVHRDAESVEYTPEEEWTVKRKIDNRVLPLVVCSYVFNQFGGTTSCLAHDHELTASTLPVLPLDRNNMLDHLHSFELTNTDPKIAFSGNAHVLPAFNANYGITNNDKWTLALSIFYVGYCLLEIPANILQRHIGANRFFFIALIFWGLASISFTFGKGYPALIALRVLLGIGEAGYYAGMIYYLSFWYKRHELALRISLCMTGTIPGTIGGLLAFGLVRAHTPVLEGWQFLFLIEAIPTLIMAFMILFFLPSFPFSASFLTPRQRAIAQARLNRDQKPQSHGGMNGWAGFKAIVTDINSWLFTVLYAGFNIGVATIAYFLPTLIRNLGFSSINAQGLTVAPYAVGWFMVLFQSWHSDRTKDRGFHVMGSCSVAFTGYIILATTVHRSVGAAYFAMFLVVGGVYSLFPLVMSWAANTFSPTSKRGVGTAFIVSISNCIAIAAPQIYFDPETDFRKGHAISAGCLVLACLMAFTIRTRLSMRNKKNRATLAALSKDEKEKLDAKGGDVWDNDPRYVFMT